MAPRVLCTIAALWKPETRVDLKLTEMELIVAVELLSHCGLPILKWYVIIFHEQFLVTAFAIKG